MFLVPAQGQPSGSIRPGRKRVRATAAGTVSLRKAANTRSRERFDEAAALHAGVGGSDVQPWQTGRIAAMLSSASAWLEALRHREAAERADGDIVDAAS
ncbi:hypothetical protein [Sorangium sp. So ce233]|uniref:hypothetical protein n=1 Tax=Sorangium sp. So ce233 TaxID=3133290 RepID=UPI003F63B298